ncbi:protein phosphatase [Pseudorhodobacter turbinis]|uniref:Protein phosphatase n=1 Tax=Pseudorhodobacter turbinis TaxID=2500533 RepID=A0A4P8EHQ2_9RHOB|nr:protein-tyrosine phosphatase family protein [Pseudorhodobacter turbinis]QCO56283.1 protein phosphatase [Pseudorhodobacter turbinis]
MAFELAEIAVGGGVLGLCACPQAADVPALRADLVLTLLEEMPAGLAAALAGAAIAQRHFPIADFCVPPQDSMGEWAALSHDLHGVLAQGGRVIIHCRAGCGRTGMIALRLMEEAREPDALARLRAVRPCAVETEAQMAWALA